MKLQIERADLLTALERCSAANETLTPHACIGKTLLTATTGGGGSEPDVLQLYSNDLHIAIDVAAGASVEKPGSIGVATKNLLSVVHALPEGMVRLSVEGGKLVVIGQGRRRSQLPTLSADIFPNVSEPDPASPNITIPSALLARVIGSVKHAAEAKAKDGRVHLQTIRLEVADGEIIAVATDSYRLAKRCLPSDGLPNFEVTIPRALIGTIEKLCHDSDAVKLSYTGRSLCVETEDCLITSLLPETQFPPWRAMMSATVGELACTVGRDALLDAIKGVMAARLGAGVVALSLAAPFDSITISLDRDEGEASDHLSVLSSQGLPLQLCYEPTYLSEAIRSAGEEVRLLVVNMATDVQACLFESGSGHDTYVAWVCALAAPGVR